MSFCRRAQSSGEVIPRHSKISSAYNLIFEVTFIESILTKAVKFVCGIRGPLLLWIKHYLSNRQQRVIIDGSSSYPSKVISGVPQGIVLAPLLFFVL